MPRALPAGRAGEDEMNRLAHSTRDRIMDELAIAEALARQTQAPSCEAISPRRSARSAPAPRERTQPEPALTVTVFIG